MSLPMSYAGDPLSPAQASEHDPGIHLGTLLIESGAIELKELSLLRKEGWEREDVDTHFASQRHTADTAGPELGVIWFKKMKRILDEINRQERFAQIRQPLTFLDLGCCPGGFSSYILDQSAQSTGVGISLPEDQGGHAFHLEDYHRKNYELLSADLTRFQLGPSPIESQRLQTLPLGMRANVFDLVLLDGHHLRTHVNGAGWDGHRLLVSQLIIALQAVKEGGTVVMKLSKPEAPNTAKILYILDMLSARLSTCKPRTMHANRGTFYAIAKGVGQGVQLDRLPIVIEGLKRLWVELTFGGAEGMGRYLHSYDFDFVISTSDLAEDYLPRLTQLGRAVWSGQAEALKKFLKKKGSRL